MKEGGYCYRYRGGHADFLLYSLFFCTLFLVDWIGENEVLYISGREVKVLVKKNRKSRGKVMNDFANGPCLAAA
jgi:hypothetical protein